MPYLTIHLNFCHLTMHIGDPIVRQKVSCGRALPAEPFLIGHEDQWVGPPRALKLYKDNCADQQVSNLQLGIVVDNVGM